MCNTWQATDAVTDALQCVYSAKVPRLQCYKTRTEVTQAVLFGSVAFPVALMAGVQALGQAGLVDGLSAGDRQHTHPRIPRAVPANEPVTPDTAGRARKATQANGAGAMNTRTASPHRDTQRPST